MQRINQVERLAGKLRLTKEEWDLLEKYAESKSYPELKRCAAGVLEHKRMAREFNRPSIEEIPFNNLDEERKEEIGELLYNDIVFFIEEADAVPNEKQLKRITKDIFKEYLRGFHWRIIPDATWEESMKKVLADALRDMEQPEFEE